MEIGLLLEGGREGEEPNKLGFAMSRCAAVCRVARERTALDEGYGGGGVLNFPLVWPKMIVVVMVLVMIIMMA